LVNESRFAPETNQTEVPVSENVAADEFSLRETARRSEREIIVSALEKVRYNKSKAARLLNIDRKTLYNKMKQYDIPLQ